LNFFLDRVLKREMALDSIVIDEFQRIKDSKVHTQVVEVIKGLADRGANVTVALVGVTTRGEELVKDPEYPRYLGRHVTVIRLRPMTESEALEIFQRREISFNVAFPLELQQKISWMSCGYPYIVHKLALQSCFAWLVRSTAQIVRDLVVPWLRKYILRQKEIQMPDVKSLSVSIEPDDVTFAVGMFVNEYEGNHSLAMESLQGLGQTELERLLSGSVDEIETYDQYFPCYGRAKEYLKSVGSTGFTAIDVAPINERGRDMRDGTNQKKLDAVVADVDNLMTAEETETSNQSEGEKVRKVKRTSPKAVDIAVVTIKPEEYAAVLRHLEFPESPTDLGRKRNRYAWRVGFVGSQWGTKYSVVVAMAGIAGTNVAQSAVHATVDVFRPRYVLVIGIAGGLVNEKERRGPVDSWPIRKGDVVVSSVIYGYEYGKVDEGGFIPRHDLTHQVDSAILRAAQTLPIIDSQWPDFLKIQRPASTVHPPRVLAAPVASGDKVVDDPSASFFEAVWNSWPKLRAVEMEGAGAAAAVKDIVDSGKPLGLAMIRGISDIPTSPDDRGEESTGQTAERDNWTDYASETAATFAVRLISKAWPEPPRSSV
jgi:nucleoside phosphorylase